MNLLATIAQRNRYAKAVLALSPSAYWRLAETSGTVAKDVMGSYDGTIVNGFTAAAGAIAGNGAMTFNGTSQYINLGDVLDMGSGNLTIGAWAKTSSTGVYLIFSKTASTNLASRYGVGIVTGKMYSVLQGVSGVGTEIYGTGGFADGAWHHFVFVFDRSANLSFYADGVLDKAVSMAAYAGNFQSAILARIGASCAANLVTPNGFFDGSLDEISIHPAALTAAQVLALYQSR